MTGQKERLTQQEVEIIRLKNILIHTIRLVQIAARGEDADCPHVPVREFGEETDTACPIPSK
jgi:hypothetical protein